MSEKIASLQGERYYLLYLLLLCGLLFFPGLGARDFWAPVEPRYAEIARIMFDKGEWIVPRVNGDLYTDKPILYFWLVLIASKIAGAVNEWTVRLPVALGGTGFVLGSFFFARDFFSPRIGLLAAAMLATSMRVVWEARWAHVDSLFCWFFVLALYYAARAFIKGRSNDILVAYFFMGLATLAKGLIGVVLPALLLVGFMIARRDWRAIAAAKLHLAIPIFLLVVAPWVYLVSSATDGKWLSDFIYVHHLQRYTAGAGHRQPVYYYLTTLPVDFLPWTIFVIPALAAYRPYRRAMVEPAKLFAVLWFFTVLLFFTASDTKRDLYLMPLLPTLAFLVAHCIDDLAAGRLAQGALYRSLALSFFALVVVSGLALPAAAWLLRRDAFSVSLPVAAALVAGGGLVVFYLTKGQPSKVVAATVLLMGLSLLSAVTWIFPYIEPFKSRRFFSLEVEKIVPPTATLYIYADTMNDFNYYTRREIIPVVRSPAEVKERLAGRPGAFMLIKSRDVQRLGIIAPERIRATGGVGDTVWCLVALGNSPAL
jgi:4-amino-4-deoxy-L-arabinose transferase-like glycosyltransferase